MPTTSEEKFKATTLFRRLLAPAEITIREDKKKGTLLRFSASSEAPVERWYGMEILSHQKSAVKLTRAKNGAMPLLFNHNVDDPIGMIDNAWLEEGRLMVDASPFDTPRAAEVQTMIGGGLRNVSIAYRVNVIEEDKKTETFTVTDWEPYEVSIVSVPADPSVGIGRGSETEYEVRMIRAVQPADSAATREAAMAEKEEKTAVLTADEKTGGNGSHETEGSKVVSALELEKNRKRAIENLCKANKLDDKYKDYWIGAGLSIEAISDDILRILEERGKTNPQPLSRIGLGAQETQRFSLMRALRACIEKDWTMAPFELECSRTVAQKLGRMADPNRFFVPYEVLERPVEVQREQRVLTAGVSGAGGYLVATVNVGFIEMLRNRSVALRMGIRELSGLVGSVTIPRQSAAATAFWLSSESTQVTASQQTFVQVAMSPKTVGAYTEISRQLLLQSSPGAEGIVTDDLAQVVAIAADLAVLNGSGAAGQPTGIINTSGIGSVTGTAIGYAGILTFQTQVASSNVVPMAGGYVTTPTVAALLMQRQRFTSTDSPLWLGNIWDGAVPFQMTQGGFRAMSSNQMPSANMLFGDWQETIMAQWGVLEVEVNPYANFQAGIIGVRALFTMDVGVRRAFAFSLATGIT